jgi:2-keto-3-deoxy-6-phosphogluconate aldolase
VIDAATARAVIDAGARSSSAGVPREVIDACHERDIVVARGASRPPRFSTPHEYGAES